MLPDLSRLARTGGAAGRGVTDSDDLVSALKDMLLGEPMVTRLASVGIIVRVANEGYSEPTFIDICIADTTDAEIMAMLLEPGVFVRVVSDAMQRFRLKHKDFTWGYEALSVFSPGSTSTDNRSRLSMAQIDAARHMFAIVDPSRDEGRWNYESMEPKGTGPLALRIHKNPVNHRKYSRTTNVAFEAMMDLLFPEERDLYDGVITSIVDPEEFEHLVNSFALAIADEFKRRNRGKDATVVHPYDTWHLLDVIKHQENGKNYYDDGDIFYENETEELRDLRTDLHRFPHEATHDEKVIDCKWWYRVEIEIDTPTGVPNSRVRSALKALV